jgi:hypothetical protein
MSLKSVQELGASLRQCQMQHCLLVGLLEKKLKIVRDKYLELNLPKLILLKEIILWILN